MSMLHRWSWGQCQCYIVGVKDNVDGTLLEPWMMMPMLHCLSRARIPMISNRLDQLVQRLCLHLFVLLVTAVHGADGHRQNGDQRRLTPTISRRCFLCMKQWVVCKWKKWMERNQWRWLGCVCIDATHSTSQQKQHNDIWWRGPFTMTKKSPLLQMRTWYVSRCINEHKFGMIKLGSNISPSNRMGSYWSIWPWWGSR